MAHFNRIVQLNFLVEKITEIKKRIAEMKTYRNQIINDIHERTAIDKGTIIAFIDQDPYNNKLMTYQNNVMTSVLIARNAIPNPNRETMSNNNNSNNNNNNGLNISLYNTPDNNPTTVVSKTGNCSATPNSTKSLPSNKTNLEEKKSLITSTPSNVNTPSYKRTRSRSNSDKNRSRSNSSNNANKILSDTNSGGVNENSEVSLHSALNLLKENNNINNIVIKKEKTSPLKCSKKSKFNHNNEGVEYVEIQEDTSDDFMSNEELDLLSQLPGLECNPNKNVDDQ
jgi:hypothetical protein